MTKPIEMCRLVQLEDGQVIMKRISTKEQENEKAKNNNGADVLPKAVRKLPIQKRKP